MNKAGNRATSFDEVRHIDSDSTDKDDNAYAVKGKKGSLRIAFYSQETQMFWWKCLTEKMTSFSWTTTI